MRTSVLMILSVLAGIGFLVGTHVLFSDALAASAWFQANRVCALAGFIILASIVYGALLGALFYCLCRDQLQQAPQRVTSPTQ